MKYLLRGGWAYLVYGHVAGADGVQGECHVILGPVHLHHNRGCRPVWQFVLTCVFLLSSIPTFLQRPYNVPLGIPNSVAAFCTAMPPRMASSAVLRSSCTPPLSKAISGDTNVHHPATQTTLSMFFNTPGSTWLPLR